MGKIKLPQPLQPGDKLRVIAPSGGVREWEALEKGLELWRKRGYRLELTPGFDQQWGYLAGRDANRQNQLSEAIADPDSRAILCIRGGYGTTRLLENWQWPESFQQHPQWLIGFSDITALLWSLYQAGVSGVHAPVLTTLASEPESSLERLWNWVEQQTLSPLQGNGWGGGTVQGILLPANLTVATHLLATPLQPDLNGVILALEDVTEAPYRIDRYLTQWRMSGAFKQVSGLVLGRFSRCIPAEGVPSLSVEEVLRDRLADLNLPIISDLPFGHDGVNAALPVGIPVELNADTGILQALP